MKRILIVEDNKTLAKLIAKKIQQTLDYEVDVAYKFSEAKLFLKMYSYFITLLDINLPDAPDGEVVDYVLAKDNHVIVLTANHDKNFRKKMLQKNIIDYVNKSGVDDINYVVQTIARLEKNQAHKVLVVDDSMVFRNSMKNMLQNLFLQVITVAHGEEALGMLKTHPDISLVITDYNMPVMNGLELTHEIRKEHNKSALCIIAISSNNEEDINAQFLKHGANDYINKPFSKEEFSCRINNSIEALENLNIVSNHINRDYLTGLYNKKYFFSNMNSYEDEIQVNGEQYAIGIINIDHFKKINDTYGHDIGDDVIIRISEVLSSTTNYRDVVARFGGEEFCVVLKNVNRFSAEEIYNRLRLEVEKTAIYLENKEEIRFTVSIGVVMSSEDSFEDMLDEADMMLHRAKQEGRNRVIMG